MRCVNCSTELIPGKLFCHACGTRQPIACTNCGSPIEPGFRFCPECGTPVPGEAAAAPAGAPRPAAPAAPPPAPVTPAIPETLAAKIRASQGVVAGERKLVTVMFCDLVGSTAIAERLDPEDFRDLLEEYMALVFREVYRVEGIITHLAGDGVMALFGAPVAHEDAPYRAVYSALEIRQALAKLNAQSDHRDKVDLQVRIGVHTGPVVVGTVGSDLKMDYTAIGDTTNLAQRLQSVADPGMVLISEATHRLVRGFFEVLPARRFEVKGKREPVAAHEVRGLSETTTAIAVAEARGLTPLVGRVEELAQLTACYDRLAGLFPQVVTVVGDAGSGKSRLIYEMKQRLAEVPVVFFEARCSAMTQAVPYAPWVAMLRQYFGISSDDGEAEACAKISERLGAQASELADTYPALCQVMNLGGSHNADTPEDDAVKRETFEAVSALVYKASELAPVVMIIEDVHWIDEPSREMLALAVGKTARSRLMMLISHRPEHQTGWRVKSAFTQLTLGPLSDEETVEIVRGVAGGPLPGQLERRIVQKAEGNPFFTEEITRTLVEEGYLLRSDGQVRLTRPVDEIRMPGTVEELIGARLDRLGPQAKRVVQVAAVLGRQFHRDQLIELLAGESIDVSTELGMLEERGIIHRKSLLTGDEFRFGESLTQEVAYEGLLLRQRRELHDRIGALIEAMPGEPNAERSALLAHHYTRSENRDKAIAALLRAARDAERIPSFRTAARFYRSAYELAEAALVGGLVSAESKATVVETALGILRMSVIYGIFEHGDPEEAALRGRQLAEEIGDYESLAELCSLHGLVISSRGPDKFPAGHALIEQALEIAERHNLGLSKTRISRALAWDDLFDGRFADSLARIQGVIAGIDEARLPAEGKRRDVYLGAMFMRDRIHFHADDIAIALPAAHRTYEMAVTYPNRTVQSGSAVTMALTYLARGEYARAREWADRSLEVARAIGSVSHLRSASALSLLARHELDEPVSGDRHLELLENPPLTGIETLNCQTICEALLAIGDVKRAEQCAERSYQNAGGRLRELGCALALGEVLTRLGPARWAEAERWLDRAHTLAQAIPSRSGQAASSLARAELAQATGDAEAATRHAEVARAAFGALGFTRYHARAERLLAELGAPTQKTA